jgi:non-ribosomal peptide synthetase component E (peptide arylation enzyme)
MSFQLSGGTTGVPKIIPRFHGEYLAYAEAFGASLGMTESDRYLWSLPLSHNAGMILVLVPCILTGATMVLLERFEPEPFLSLIARENVTLAGSIGPIAPRLLALDDVSRFDLSSMRYFFALNRASDLETHLGVRSGNVYGITEGLLMASRPDDLAERRHATVGAPVSARDHVVLLEPGTEIPVAAGRPGELCFRGPSMLTAYFKDPLATSSVFTPSGLFRTGDLVLEHTIERAQCFSFEGRIKDNIDRGGEKFGTDELEILLSTHPDIVGSAFVGMPDPVLGERVCALLVIRPAASAPTVEEIGSFLQGRGVAKFKLPERVEVINEFPLTSVGKLDRPALRSQIAQILRDVESANFR